MMKKVLFLTTLFSVFYGCSCTKNVVQNPCMVYERKIDSLQTHIFELEEEQEILLNELKWREEEVSYWGQKYDSIKDLRKK